MADLVSSVTASLRFFDTIKGGVDCFFGLPSLCISYSSRIAQAGNRPPFRMGTHERTPPLQIGPVPAEWTIHPCELRRRHGPLFVLEPKIQKCVFFPARNCNAASKIDPGLFNQESLKIGIAHSGDVFRIENGADSGDAIAAPLFQKLGMPSARRNLVARIRVSSSTGRWRRRL